MLIVLRAEAIDNNSLYKITSVCVDGGRHNVLMVEDTVLLVIILSMKPGGAENSEPVNSEYGMRKECVNSESASINDGGNNTGSTDTDTD